MQVEPSPPAGIVEAGVDYLSMSMKVDSNQYAHWCNRAFDAIMLIGDAGNITKRGSFRGYDGIWAGGAFYGRRDDGAHCHISGVWSSRLFAQLYEPSAHYSRLDVQCTVRVLPSRTDLAKEGRSLATAANEILPETRRRKITLIEGSDGGATLYIGTRNSEVFCRLYNKGAQSNEPFYEDCWRYEVEAHNDSATQAAAYIFGSNFSQGVVASSTVWQYFNKRGIQPLYTREEEITALIPNTAPATDITRKLTWLSQQVRPTVLYLRSLVPPDILEAALGYGERSAPLPSEHGTKEELQQWHEQWTEPPQS